MSLHLVCLPFAGSHLDPFRVARDVWETNLPGLHSQSITYSGHGSRINVDLRASLVEMAHDALELVMADRVEHGVNDPIVLLGYSMGGLVAYELSHLLADLGIPQAGLLAMACTPPARVCGTGLELDSDADLLAHCEQYGLIDGATFPTGALRAMLLPPLRNDIVAVDRYPGATRGHRALAPGMCVATYNGLQDLTVEHPSDWLELGDGDGRSFTYDAGHFFLTECAHALTQDVTGTLARLFERTPA